MEDELVCIGATVALVCVAFVIIAFSAVFQGAVDRVVAWHQKRRFGFDLQLLEDEDTVGRWGMVSQVQDIMTSSSNGEVKQQGLRPSEISSLRGLDVVVDDGEDECSICLQECCSGEQLRKLASCGHSFHRSCIDLWLLRCACCPLCKCEVNA